MHYNHTDEEEEDDDKNWQRATKVIRLSHRNDFQEKEMVENLAQHFAHTSHRRQWKVHRCRTVDASTVDISISLRCCYGEDEYIFTFLQDALADHYRNMEMEVLVESPGYLPLMDKKYTQEDLLFDLNDKESNQKRFDDLGLLVCHTRVDEHSLDCIRDTAYRFIQQVEDHFEHNHPDIDYQNGDFLFQEIGSRSGLRYDVRIDMNGDAQWSALRQVAIETAPWLDLVQDIFGEGNWKVEANVIYSKPGAQNQGWHCDGGHLEAEADENGHGHAPPYALCVFLPLIDLNPHVGFTQFFLGSHKTSQLVGFGPAAEWLAADFDGILCAGQSVMYDYRLMHRGMANYEKLRPIIQFLYTKHFYIETKNYGSVSMYAKE
jgi:ectoine hydroxylase-related dioxygenase (phytanoyl-CoA dioxygenase family)